MPTLSVAPADLRSCLSESVSAGRRFRADYSIRRPTDRFGLQMLARRNAVPEFEVQFRKPFDRLRSRSGARNRTSASVMGALLVVPPVIGLGIVVLLLVRHLQSPRFRFRSRSQRDLHRTLGAVADYRGLVPMRPSGSKASGRGPCFHNQPTIQPQLLAPEIRRSQVDWNVSNCEARVAE